MAERCLLIIEDDPGLQSQMRWCFEEFQVEVAGNAKEADAILRRDEPQVVTLDLGLPPDPGGTSEGFALLQSIAELLPRTKVIVITGREEREHAIRAIGDGAYDFYQKPIESDTLRFVVDRAFRLWELEADNARLAQVAPSMPLDGFITASPNMLDLVKRVERVAPTDATVLIRGETGTGKELIAKAVHELSDRSDGPFAAINCAAIPENLLESELFGHEKGSFTGAVNRKVGKIEAATGGTLFLDEIGDMPLPLQAKILRFLQERTVERVGSNSTIPVDVRVVSATHRGVEDMIADGTFREDLFFRISEVALVLPPLKEREGDAVLLANALVSRYAKERTLRFSSACLAVIESWSWPGNIRELENRIKRACIMVDGPTINAEDLELEAQTEESPLNLKLVRAQAERTAVVQALGRCQNNLSQTARLLGVSRPTLYNLLEKHGFSEHTTDD
jgi:two-component system NtrC family response regulator